ncbi:hypothetical protein VOLCADRAFT_90571 [Volvox carteri f. nagariensis]|uniref:Uncharacterized protein n=1 Tax=Volvox carteri f. nagariensis TaxID=3068 RepID=D8TUR8_VOLCA|nr:uncharacterized protein VOLCADRAFT_90571 [Volvox carteri f. nagariensis]EFJ48872.1 hypothetical protein VOLCADRAFT_90571 [Volvox carteri f. nagariensis]|eukprot:XP_002950204.1 hypothetical protein VOLCADRAFT_90571 [Volvox carteri f. nagariensis]
MTHLSGLHSHAERNMYNRLPINWLYGNRSLSSRSSAAALGKTVPELVAEGIGSVAHGSVTEELAQLTVVLHDSAVADSSSVTYKAGWRRFVRFCICMKVAGVPEADARPRQRGSDLNRDLVCLFIAHAVGRYATSTVTGTLSVLADWQRFMGVSPEADISHDPLVKRTLGQALRRAAVRLESAPTKMKAPLPLGVLELLMLAHIRLGGVEEAAAVAGSPA